VSTVRVATVDDAEEIARVHIQAWRETYSRLVEPGELDGLSVGRRADRWRQIIAPGDVIVWVAESGVDVVGFSSAGMVGHDERPRPLELQSIYLLAEHHGSGAGQALLDAAVGDAPAFLFVAQDNPRAVRFYERNRFVADGVTESYPLVRTSVTSLRMVR
jgi:GNAT superfamily N-acetyltransferase